VRPPRPSNLACACALLLGLQGCGARDQSPQLPALAIDGNALTVSGISAGGYMATQIEVAYSSRVRGAAILAAGPWNCAQGELERALGACVAAPREAVDVPALLASAGAAADEGRIDPLEHLGDDRVWLFHGTEDRAVTAGVVVALRDFYQALLPRDHITFVDSIAAGHVFPTRERGGACTQTQAPFIGACNYDGAGELLRSLYGELEPPASQIDAADLRRFDQRPFRDAAGSVGLADEGFIFVPPACHPSADQCRLHVAFHGCAQGITAVDDVFVRQTGYLEWAASNRIVVLFPQVRSTLSPLNPLGCWDWWGYEDKAYAMREGRQIRAVMAMIDRLARPPDED
jgi:poly(3-hydroxybutyrate) depolymerase